VMVVSVQIVLGELPNQVIVYFGRGVWLKC